MNPKTIRFYEETGLLPAPRRDAAGYRRYGHTHRDRLRFIVKAKSVGLTLREIGEILALRDGGTESCAHVRQLVDRKLAADELALLYTQPGCAESVRVRAWLTERGIPSAERDVADNPEAAMALVATGVFATPLLSKETSGCWGSVRRNLSGSPPDCAKGRPTTHPGDRASTALGR